MRHSFFAGSLAIGFSVSATLGHADASGLGKIDFPTSCTPAAQSIVSDGTLLLHHMMYRMASARFETAAEADPNCAMAQWGIAMSNFHPLWPGIQSPPERKKGLAAIEAVARLDAGTSLEQDFIAAAATFYDATLTTYPERKAAWAVAQRQIYADHPGNTDAAAFAALAMLATAPPNDRTLALQREAGTILEGLHDNAPKHPGALHYLIHAHDYPALAEAALPFVEAYLELAPDNPHALHMPSHIMTRLGRWGEAADLNRRSAAAVLAQPKIGGTVSNHYPHALDYLAYALLQLGDIEGASDAVAKLLNTENMQDVFGTAYAVAAAPARLALEQENWHAAAALPDIPYHGLEWDRYPHALAIVAFVQGIGAARGGRAAGAEAAIARLDDLTAIMSKRGMHYWVTLANAQSGAIKAWLAYAADDPQALSMMVAAADLEDSVGKAPVTPSHVLPVREQLGDMQRMFGELEAALVSYETALVISPNRRRSLEGMAEASEN